MDLFFVRVLSNNDFNAFWDGIAQDKPLKTPDKGRTASFTVIRRSDSGLEVRTHKGNTVRIRREAFGAVLRHLAQEHHGAERPCIVASSQQPARLSGLCGQAGQRQRGRGDHLHPAHTAGRRTCGNRRQPAQQDLAALNNCTAFGLLRRSMTIYVNSFIANH